MSLILDIMNDYLAATCNRNVRNCPALHLVKCCAAWELRLVIADDHQGVIAVLKEQAFSDEMHHLTQGVFGPLKEQAPPLKALILILTLVTPNKEQA